MVECRIPAAILYRILRDCPTLEAQHTELDGGIWRDSFLKSRSKNNRVTVRRLRDIHSLFTDYIHRVDTGRVDMSELPDWIREEEIKQSLSRVRLLELDI